MMKIITSCILAFFTLTPAAFSAETESALMQDYARLLQKYALDTGIDYQAWKEDPESMRALEKMIQYLESHGPEELSEKGQIAFYSNAYNLFVLHGVLQEYPVETVKEIAFAFGFFTRSRHTLDGEKISLNRLEKEILLKRFSDVRIHFIINCASASCPPLPSEPLTASNLDRIMEASTRKFINSHPDGVQVKDQTVYLSKIFDWYESDFKNSAGSLIAFINPYRKTKLPLDSKIKFLDYNWSLNDTN
jgi:hypothetical protein